MIERGDPYQAQIEATVKGVMERGRWANPHTLCYQSRSGPGRWLQPFIHETLQEIAARGAERVLVVPIAFVSDHVETLHEINIEARELAENLGIQQFETMEGLNDSPRLHRRPRGFGAAQGHGEGILTHDEHRLGSDERQAPLHHGPYSQAQPTLPCLTGALPIVGTTPYGLSTTLESNRSSRGTQSFARRQPAHCQRLLR